MKDIKAEVAKPRKAALYMRMNDHEWIACFEVNYTMFDEHYQPLPAGESRETTREGWVRISEVKELTFTAIDSDEVVRKAVDALDDEERKVIRELNAKLADIRGRKHQLLALTHEVAA